MADLVDRTRELCNGVSRISNEGTREYLSVSNFGNSSVTSEPGFAKPFFRIFTPVKAYKGRKLNALYGESFNPFKDTLMDYPTVVQHKLGKVGLSTWENYNRLVSLHISRCPLNCWHCYIEECIKSTCSDCMAEKHCDRSRRSNMAVKEGWFSAKEIVDGFIEQRDSDRKMGVHSNILRITGGEPFLVPQLLLETLGELKDRQLENQVFLWTETNLVPLVGEANKAIVTDELLHQLAGYRNFCVHPCFHGLNENNFKDITGQNIGNFDFLLTALERLLNAGIDIYPTLGSNMSAPKDVVSFYNKIAEIDALLPLRFCLIEYDLDYQPIRWRRTNIPDFAAKHERVYDRFQIIEKWDESLRKRTGYGYSVIPRHLVPIRTKRKGCP